MTNFIASLRHGFLVAVFFSFISAALMLVVGGVKFYKAVYGYVTGTGTTVLTGTAGEKVIEHLSEEDAAIARIIESVDAFLIALVMLYLGFGMYALFCERKGSALANLVHPSVVPKNIGQLKETLAHLIIVVLFVLFTRQVWLNLDNLTWEMLVLPSGIALLALALRLADFSKDKTEST